MKNLPREFDVVKHRVETIARVIGTAIGIRGGLSELVLF
jgi:hypothetical protein